MLTEGWLLCLYAQGLLRVRVYGKRNRFGVSLKAGLEIMRAKWPFDSLNHFFVCVLWTLCRIVWKKSLCSQAIKGNCGSGLDE